MRWNGIWLAAVFCFAAGIGEIHGEAAEKTVAVEKKASNQPDIQEAMNQRFDLDIVEMPLKDVMQYLQRETGIQFLLSLKKLEEASISSDTPITKNLKQVRLRTLLELMLKDLELTFVENDGLLVITTPEDAESRLDVRVYDCRDLLAMPAPQVPSAADRQPSRPAPMPASNAETPAARVEGCGSIAGGMSRRRVPETELERRTEELAVLVTSSVRPDSWDDYGGPGNIRGFNGLFVVSQTRDVHEQVERVLDMLRQAAGIDAKAGRVVR
jgi:general secretion pathway protein D